MNLKIFRKIATSDEGAVTVDWVVLTAVVLGLTVMAANTLSDGALGLTSSLATHMSAWAFE